MLRLADAVDLYDPGVQRVYTDRYKMAEMNWKKFVKDESTELYIDTESSFSGFGQAKILNENTGVTFVDPSQGFDIGWTQREFALGFQVTKKLWKYDKQDAIKKLPAKLADAILRRIEQDCEDYLYNGAQASTSYSDADGVTVTISGGDGYGLGYQSHTSESGGTAINNKVYNGTTYNMDLAEDALEATLTYVAPRIVDEQGNKITHTYGKILVTDNLIPTIRRIMLSEGRVGSMDNDINIHKGEFDIVKLPQFNSSGSAYWFLLDDNYNDLRIKFSQKPILEGPESVFATGSFRYKATAMYDLRHNDFRGWITSTGANA